MKTYLTAFLVLLYTGVSAQAKKDVKISGSIPAMAGKTIVLVGPDHLSKDIPVSKSGTFAITLNTDSSFCHLAATPLYLQPGTNLVVTAINDSTYTFKGQGSVENTLLSKVLPSLKNYLPLNGKTLTDKVNFIEPGDYQKLLSDYKTNALSLLNAQPVSPYFLRVQTQSIDYVIRYYTLQYMAKYGVDPQKQKKVYEFMNNVKPADIRASTAQVMALMDSAHVKKMDFAKRVELNKSIWANFDLNNGDVYKYSISYYDLVDSRINQLYMAERSKTQYDAPRDQNEIKYEIVKKEITNSYMHNFLLHHYAMLVLKANKNTDKIYADYITSETDPVFIADAKEVYENSKLVAVGSLSPTFAYNDIKGNSVSLASLKGSYVYIDVWAQWCGPCKGEIPSLKEVEKKYEHQNIKFVSISVDKMVDINKWKAYVTDNNLSGIQVITDNDWNADFIKKYNINSIPRFILIDPDGKIVSSNADRPSNPKLQEQLDKLLPKS